MRQYDTLVFALFYTSDVVTCVVITSVQQYRKTVKTQTSA